jgi:hypothetical protein
VVQGGKAVQKKEEAVVVLVSPIDEEAEKVEQDFIRMERELLDLEGLIQQQFKAVFKPCKIPDKRTELNFGFLRRQNLPESLASSLPAIFFYASFFLDLEFLIISLSLTNEGTCTFRLFT